MGTLLIVATPIGNLKDITLRAIETLKVVDYILCEDTRVTGRLLHHLEIDKPMKMINDFSEEKMISQIIPDLTNGKNVALVSDAGTPLISDPGFKLVREAIRIGIKVESIPGPTAAISALTVSGLATDKFMFVGYLSKKDGKRKSTLVYLKKINEIVKTTFIIYESPFRVLKTLEAIKEVFGDIEVVVCRELTKIHEEVKRGNISAVQPDLKLKGEFVIVF